MASGSLWLCSFSSPISAPYCHSSTRYFRMHSVCKEIIRKLTCPIVRERNNNIISVPKRAYVLPLNSPHLRRTILTAGTRTPAGGMRRSGMGSGISTGRAAFSVGVSEASGSARENENREIMVQHILVPGDQLKLLLELQHRIVKDGADLSDLATEHSICSSKEEGGMLGWVQKGQLIPEFEEAAFSSPLNKLVRCKTKFGWHLLQVLAEREGGLLKDIEPEEFYVKMQEHNFVNEAQLMDVREPDEISVASLPGFKVYPLRQFGSWALTITDNLDPGKDTYVLCHHGMRSLQVAKWLQMQVVILQPLKGARSLLAHLTKELLKEAKHHSQIWGFKRVFNISGGIHAYSQKVDTSIPTY